MTDELLKLRSDIGQDFYVRSDYVWLVYDIYPEGAEAVTVAELYDAPEAYGRSYLLLDPVSGAALKEWWSRNCADLTRVPLGMFED